MLVEPWPELEIMESRPAMVVNCRSSGVATAEAMVSGLAPGRLGVDRDGGVIDLRQIADRQALVSDDAEQRDARHQKAGGNRPPDKGFGNIHAEPPLAPPSAAPACAPSAVPRRPLCCRARAATALR